MKNYQVKFLQVFATLSPKSLRFTQEQIDLFQQFLPVHVLAKN